MKLRYIKAAAITLCAVITTACKSGADINLTPYPDETQDETAVNAELVIPFIMPNEDTEEYRRYADILGEDSCVSGYMYMQNRSSDAAELFLPYKFDENAGILYTSSYVFAFTEEGQLLKAKRSINDPLVQRLYTAEGTVDNFISDTNMTRLYFNDGDRYFYVGKAE